MQQISGGLNLAGWDVSAAAGGTVLALIIFHDVITAAFPGSPTFSDENAQVRVHTTTCRMCSNQCKSSCTASLNKRGEHLEIMCVSNAAAQISQLCFFLPLLCSFNLPAVDSYILPVWTTCRMLPSAPRAHPTRPHPTLAAGSALLSWVHSPRYDCGMQSCDLASPSFCSCCYGMTIAAPSTCWFIHRFRSPAAEGLDCCVQQCCCHNLQPSNSCTLDVPYLPLT
jgi:hypothetical protein